MIWFDEGCNNRLGHCDKEWASIVGLDLAGIALELLGNYGDLFSKRRLLIYRL